MIATPISQRVIDISNTNRCKFALPQVLSTLFGVDGRYGMKIGESVQLQETQGIAYGLARVVIGWSQALLLGGVLILGANRVFSGQMSGPELTTFVFYTNFVTDASFDVGDQARVYVC